MSMKFTAIAAAVLLASACSATNSGPSSEQVQSTQNQVLSESDKANQFFDTMFEEQLARSPMYLAYMGRKTDNDKWDNLTEAYQTQTHQLVKAQLERLKQLDVSKLDANTAVSYELAKQSLEEQVADYQWRLYSYPVNQMFGSHTDGPAMLINQHRIDNLDDANAYITRLHGLKTYLNQLEGALERRADAGIVAPKFVFDHVLRDSQNLIKGAPFDNGEDNALYADFKRKLDTLAEKGTISAVQKADLTEQAKQALTTSFKQAYESLIAYVANLQQRADEKHGAWKFPNGEAFYNNALKRTTTTELTAKAIHGIGLSEVTRIHNEMREIKQKVGFEGDLQAFFAFMRDDKQFYLPATPEGKKQYIDDATAMIEGMKARIDELFIVKPKADLIVKQVEAFREQSAGKAFYQQPAEDGSRPGTYYANLYDMGMMPTYQMEALAYHEGVPGHHMQIAIAQELEDMPMFRRFGGYTAYVEGWGLYSEYVPKEIGLYQDPYSDFGRLAMELWRACRLVVDTGIHAMKWNREQGINYYMTNTPNSELDAIKMTERHIVMPSQATAYKIGMLKILELRAQAKQALGEQFDIREFHDVVLKNGPVPLTVLERFVKQWIEQKRT